MAANTGRCTFYDNAPLALGSRNDTRRGPRLGGGNCHVLATRVHSLDNECRSPVHHARSNAMSMLSCWLLAHNCASLACLDWWPRPAYGRAKPSRTSQNPVLKELKF